MVLPRNFGIQNGSTMILEFRGMISFDDELLSIVCKAVNAGEHLKPRATKRAKNTFYAGQSLFAKADFPAFAYATA